MPPALPLNLKLMSGRVKGIWGAVNTQERQLGDITTDRDKNPLHQREVGGSSLHWGEVLSGRGSATCYQGQRGEELCV